MSVLLLGDAREHLNAKSHDDDAELQKFIDVSESAIARRCGPLAVVTVTDRLRGESQALIVKSPPVISLTSVTQINGSSLAVADLNVTPGGAIEYLLGGWFPFRFYDVVYQAGRVTVDGDLLQGIRETTRHLWQTQRGTGSKRPNADLDIAGAAYTYTYRINELLEPHLQDGFA